MPELKVSPAAKMVILAATQKWPFALSQTGQNGQPLKWPFWPNWPTKISLAAKKPLNDHFSADPKMIIFWRLLPSKTTSADQFGQNGQIDRPPNLAILMAKFGGRQKWPFCQNVHLAILTKWSKDTRDRQVKANLPGPSATKARFSAPARGSENFQELWKFLKNFLRKFFC